LGWVLQEHRVARNLTQEVLAENAGVPLRTLQRAERGDGISQGNLHVVALALGSDSNTLLKAAASKKEGSPELRLKMKEIQTPAALVADLRRARGNLQIAPEGEHGFNEHVGAFIAELASSLGEAGHPPGKADAVAAEYILRCCEQMGFRLFIGHHQEELEHKGAVVRKPTTVVIAAAASDPRLRKTPKGLILDFIMDSRKQILHRVMKSGLTAYDWLEDLLISKSDGERRVRAEILRMHLEIRASMS